MRFRTLKEAELKDKKVLVRADFNLPLDKKTGKIKDDTRIRLALPTINYILDQGAKKLIVMSHLGRPKGKVVNELSTRQVADRFSELLGEDVKFFDHLSGREMPNDKIIMLENVQFSPGEEENDDKYAKKLAKYADVYVMDAFGQAHRKYASLVAIQKHLPSYAGP
jgi:phosphoglycerate kinase